jgi:multidrug efflux pump subunit AcrB/ABC-type multidrug transport system ATPase subunit
MSAGSFIIRRKTLIAMLFLGLVMLGVVSQRQLPVELYPDVELPLLFVSIGTMAPTDPRIIESEALIPIEGAIGTLDGIERIESTARRSRAQISIEYEKSVNITHAFLRLQEKIDELRPSLPEEYIVTVIKIPMDQISNQLMSLEVRGSGGVDRVRQVVERDIRKQFEAIDGIASVEVTGGREKSVDILLKDDVREAYGITPSRVRQLIRQQGASNTFVGHVVEDERTYFVNVVTEYTDLADIAGIVVDPRGPVLLGDIADISFGVREQETISRVNGKETVSIELSKDQLVNMIDVSDRARAVVDRLNHEFAGGDIEIVIRSDAADPIRKNIDLIVQLAITGGLLAVAVLWLFLRNLRLVLIIALAIPVSIYIAFNFFYAAGISINSLTLVGMALAVGMLVDNGVVVLENIYRLYSRGTPLDRAVTQGVSEVWRSIIAATATTVTVFLPFVFSSNFMLRILGRHVGVSIISTLLVSLVAALLLVPMVTHTILSRRGAGRGFGATALGGRAIELYRVLLKTCMRFPARTIVGTIVVFFASILICIALSALTGQTEETSSFDVFLVMPRGSTLETTDEAVRNIEERLAEIPEKEDVSSTIYTDEARITVSLKEHYVDIGGRTLGQVKEDARRRLRDFRTGDVSFEEPAASQRFRGGGGGGMERQAMRFFGFGGQNESIVVKGDDFETMRRFADNLQGYLEDMTSVDRAWIDVRPGSPELHLLFDLPLMSWSGITVQAVQSELAAFPNEVATGATLKQGVDEYAIVIRRPVDDDEDDQRTIEDLRELPLTSQHGGTVDLGDVSRMVFSEGQTEIRRVNQEKQIEIGFAFVDEIAGSRRLNKEALAEIGQLVDGLVVPEGIAVELVEEDTGVSEFKFLILAAFILIYMILASVFESLTTPLVMMFTIPLAAIGSLWLLILSGTSILDPYTLTGFLILLGVVVNNGIILIDYSLILQRRGNRPLRALLTAGLARVRPILITAITTIVAMVPLAMGKTEDVSIIGAPFAITVIGGLTFSTLFTLIFIPVVFTALRASLAWLGGLPLRLKLLQAALFAAGLWLIDRNVDSLIWRSALYVSLVFIIPAAVWFVLASLRKASAEIAGGGPITIIVRNLGKIYDQPSRFAREWRKGPSIRERRGIVIRPDAGALLWQIPLLGFGAWFLISYVTSFFRAFLAFHAVWFFALHLWSSWSAELQGGSSPLPARLRRAAGAVEPLLLWGLPLAALAVFYLRWKHVPQLVFIAVLWYVPIAIFALARRLHRRRVNIARIEGRFGGLRRMLYRFVVSIPLIGRRKTPFRALDQVSLEIGSGMFGLLGPNGAGKTTLMRIICGILEQNYGKITINGLDAARHREELQGLIGYLPQEFGTYENMTAREFLDYQAILKGLTDAGERRRMVDYVLGAVHMEESADRKIGSFSGGMKQRIGIAEILLHLPRILVVDEPTAGLDPRERIRFRNLLVELSRDRVVIFSTHIIEDIYSSCNRVAVLDRGRLLYLDDPARMTQIAEGRVWSFTVAPREFESVRREHLVVHHMRDGSAIRVRCLAASAPVPGASPARPTLEDAYLWLLRKAGSKAAAGVEPDGQHAEEGDRDEQA